ncbi:MAG: ABC transporter ATP-binding protein [Microbacteriaceae bacterium]
MISVKKLSISAPDGTTIVSDISLNLRAGSCLALVGESGAGKTLTAKALLGLLPEGLRCNAEVLRRFGEDAREYSEFQLRNIRGRQAGFIVQEALSALDPLRKIGQEISETIEIHQLLPAEKRRDRVLELLRQQNIPDPELRLGQRSHELSGGQRQRALIASVLAGEPRIIIADEPTASLDTILAAKQLDILHDLKLQGYGILLISHDLAAVAELADDIIVMQSGRVMEQGTAADVLARPKSNYTQRLLASARFEGLGLAGFESDNDTVKDSIDDAARKFDQADRVDAEVILCAERVSKRYSSSGLMALSGTSMHLNRGEVLGIAGESGSGKSTLARLLLALEKPSAGTVTLFNEPWSEVSEKQRRQRRSLVQWVPQDPLSSFNPRWRVRRILSEALAQKKLDPRAESQYSSHENRELELERLLTMVNLSNDLLDRRPRELSGGQRQRIAIARALAVNPQILICDEAVSALDVTVQVTILQLLQDLRVKLGLSIIFITHDLGVIRHFSDRVLIMHSGSIVEEGVTAELFDSPKHDYTRELLAASLHYG